VLYGHGEANQHLLVPGDQLRAAIRHGSRVVDLQGAVSEKAIIRETQWNAFGTQVLHLDFARVSADERIHLKVPVELKGEAPGAKEGGIIEHVLHEVEIEAAATDIPDSVILRLASLHMGGELTADKIELPPNAKLLTPGDTLVVHCVQPREEEEAAPAGAAEPEVIGRKPDEEEEE
jgi:large subunit ribosomal protein L25